MGQSNGASGAALWIDTQKALATPRRLVPALLVALPLLASQHAFSFHKAAADALAVAMIAGFWLVAPFAWRALPGRGPHAWRLAAYAAVGLLPFGAAVILTELTELPASFLVTGLNGAIAAGLFLVGGWGLGRDIELERALLRERARADALRRQAESAELLALRAHLDPHFLFNTLNAIAEWCAIEPLRAERALLRLSGLLRDILAGVRSERWALTRELDLARAVLDLYGVRDPERFVFVVDTPVTDGEIPPLLLLPLVENAVKHGPAAGHAGPIALRTRPDGARLRIEVDNPGPPGPPRDGGEGLRMVRERLALAYGDAASFALTEAGGGTRAVVVLPR